jgi:hypothetical protein
VQVKHLLGPLIVAVCAMACDPGLFYSIPGTRTVRADGVRYVVPVAQGVEARFQASIFTIHGRTEVQVVNGSGSTIEFRPAATVLFAGDGSTLVARCELPAEPRVSIATGETLTVRCGFEARLRLFSYEPAFEALTLRQPGVSMNGKQLDIVARMVGS